MGCPHVSLLLSFPRGCSEVKMSACNTGDLGSIPGSGRSPGEGNGNPLQDSCLENPMNREAWWATVHGVTKSRTRLSDFASLLSSFPPPIFSLLVFLLSFPVFLSLFQALPYYLAGLLVPIFISSVHFSSQPKPLCLPPCLPLLRHIPPHPTTQISQSPVLFIFYRCCLCRLWLCFPLSPLLSAVCVCLGLAKFGLWPQTVSALSLHPLPAPIS